MAPPAELTISLALILVAGFYFSPTLVALARNHDRAPLVFLYNFALGWTVVGWLLVLVWALVGRRTP